MCSYSDDDNNPKSHHEHIYSSHSVTNTALRVRHPLFGHFGTFSMHIIARARVKWECCYNDNLYWLRLPSKWDRHGTNLIKRRLIALRHPSPLHCVWIKWKSVIVFLNFIITAHHISYPMPWWTSQCSVYVFSHWIALWPNNRMARDNKLWFSLETWKWLHFPFYKIKLLKCTTQINDHKQMHSTMCSSDDYT